MSVSAANIAELVTQMRALGITRYRGPMPGAMPGSDCGVELDLAPVDAVPVEPRRKTQDELAEEQRAERERVRNVTRGATARIA